MRIAYLILAHKNPEQVKRLVRLLDSDVYIHIDRKSDMDKFHISDPKVKYINKRVNITWGGFSMIKATLKLINVARNNNNYDYYILLSGDDYPLRSLDELESFLIEHRQYSFIEYDKFDEKWQHSKERYEKFKIFEKTNIFKRVVQKIVNVFINKRGMYSKMQAYKGSQWWCLNSQSIEYILKYINENKSILRYFKHTNIPDEMFFQIILLNSHLRNKIINNNLRHILLDGKHAEILTMNNFNDLLNTEKKFFARKFDIQIDSEILDLLDQRI